ncbi:hypothetical protein [Labedella endophytica]|uniref:Bacterial Ig-like domain-containing protein n=1 Tax=Labedella endophytica TaxID=1523160 RepID=A0A433JR01_9MICO|nr:hypothetical protein [Labedella endophytica]RUQ99184.1 hypothetical protein ELQ94_12810 [Labedella endophytica]
MAQQGSAKREAVRIEGASSVTTPSVRRPVRRSPLRSLGVAALLIGLVTAGAIGTGASAALATTETPSPPAAPTAPPEDDRAEAPIIGSPSPGSVITSASTTISGTKTPGSGVQVQNGAGDVLCIIDASDAEGWSCTITLGAGAAITIQAIATGADGAAGGRTSVQVTSVPPPTILSGGSTPGNGLLRGTGIPGATVTATTSSGESCSSGADSSGAWACLLPARAADGSYSATASQVATYTSTRSDASPAVRLVLDRTVPSPPLISSPRSGSSVPTEDVRFAGSGEDGATVTVFAGSASVCQAIVSNSEWSCVAARLTVGDVRIVAIQRDAADNTSGGGVPVELTVGGSTPAPSPTPTPSGSAPGDEPSETATPTAPQPEPSPAPPTPDEPTSPAVPPPGASPWDRDTWDAATPFTTPRAPLFSSGTGPEWARTLLLAALAVAGIALASHVARGAGAVSRGATGPGATSSSPLSSPARFVLTGRNRRDVVTAPRVVPAPSSIPTVVAALVAVAGLLILSRPVDGSPAYARLLFASVTATFVVALASVAVPAVASRLFGSGRVHTTVDPRGFLVIAATVAASRFLGLEPPLLFALVLTASTSLAVSRVAEGRVAGIRILSLAVLGGASWALGSVFPLLGLGGFAASLVTETLNVLTAAALGSAAIMLLPIGASSGRSLWAASRVAWVAIGFVVVAVELVLLGSGTPAMTSAVTSIGSAAAVACIVLCLSVWIWRRYIAPALEEESGL